MILVSMHMLLQQVFMVVVVGVGITKLPFLVRERRHEGRGNATGSALAAVSAPLGGEGQDVSEYLRQGNFTDDGNDKDGDRAIEVGVAKSANPFAEEKL